MTVNLQNISNYFSSGNVEYTRHAVERMVQRNVTASSVEFAIGNDNPRVVLDSPFDLKGGKCEIIGYNQVGINLKIAVGYDCIPPKVISVMRIR